MLVGWLDDWLVDWLVGKFMVSAPPPRLWGDLTIFFLFILGGHFKFFLTLGGPNLMGGSLDMMGGVSMFRLEKISLLYLLLQACYIT